MAEVVLSENKSVKRNLMGIRALLRSSVHRESVIYLCRVGKLVWRAGPSLTFATRSSHVVPARAMMDSSDLVPCRSERVDLGPVVSRARQVVLRELLRESEKVDAVGEITWDGASDERVLRSVGEVIGLKEKGDRAPCSNAAELPHAK